MDGIEQHFQWLRIRQVAEQALSATPAWLWSADGDRLLWANTAGATLFGEAGVTALISRGLKPADPHRRQIIALARRLSSQGGIRLERMRGFGAAIGSLATCACVRLPLNEDSSVILVSTGTPVPALSFERRIAGLIDDTTTPVLALAADSRMIASNSAATAWPQLADMLADPALQFTLADAIENGHGAGALAFGQAEIFRAGTEEERVLIASIIPNPACAEVPNAATHEDASAVAETAQQAPQTLTEAGPAEAKPQPATELSSREETEPPMSVIEPPTTPESASASDSAPSGVAHAARKLPLRFMWQMNADGSFAIGSDEFKHLIGPRTSAAFNQRWQDIVTQFDLDPNGTVARATAERSTLNAVTLAWPVDEPGMTLPVELSGVPFTDEARQFAGYRGFGICRDLNALTHLDAIRRGEAHDVTPVAETQTHAAAASIPAAPEALESAAAFDAPEPAIDPHANVVPFRPAHDPRPTLTANENNAFNEIARQLSARLDDKAPAEAPQTAADIAHEPEVAEETHQPTVEPPAWAAPVAEPPRGHSQTDLTLFDRMPAGVLIYRLDRLLYANRAFLAEVGYDNLQSLSDAGGLDALFVEPGVSAASSTSDTGTPVRISSEHSSKPPADAALHTIMWDGDHAMALIFTGTTSIAPPVPVAPAPEKAAVNHETEQLHQLLDAVPDALLVLDDHGTLKAANRSARDLFAINTSSAPRAFHELFAPESRTAIGDALAAVKHGSGERSREVLAQRGDGSLLPLSMMVGRTAGTEPVTFAILRDLTMAKTTEAQLLGAQRQADRAASVKADVLARISHEVRTPLNSIIGFADVMIGERFGALGNERYVEYLKDIRASGERVIAIINDMLDLSHIETGKLDLTFISQNLNDLVEQCVGVMQPQANRERIIIRTSLARTLPWISADARALRQITMNLIGNSIHLANAGGQVIVSTALTDFGDVVLRVRDTGQGLNDNEMAAALAPFRAPMSPDDVTPGNSGVSLSLTKALVEANRAQFQIKSSPQSGTLIEVRFPATAARANSN